MLRSSLFLTAMAAWLVGSVTCRDSVFGADALPEGRSFSAEDLQFFESRIRPLLIAKCVECHGPDEQEHGLRVDSWDALIRGGRAGASLAPGKPEGSLLITAINYQDSTLQMPPDSRLSKSEVADLTRWVAIGAPHPDRLNKASTPGLRNSAIDFEAARQFWSFRPVVRPAVPEVSSSERVRNDIDRFVLAQLEPNGLNFSLAADRLTLIRRVTFDLTGLPPTPEEVQEFLRDDELDSVEKLIDRLLESPHYGEHWGRHWLDVARYSDSNGLDENVAHGNAWRYRDYVVRSFNTDKPFDQFLIEQIAGDLLPGDRLPGDEESAESIARRNDQLIATGFLALGPKVLAEVDAVKMEMDIIDEQLDTIGKSLLGLTLGCARCHDHKFDPIATRDYYSLAGVFKSSRVMEHFTKVAKWYERDVPSLADLERKTQHDRLIAEQKADIADRLEKARQELIASQPETATLPADFETQLPEATQKQLKEEREKLKQLEREATTIIPVAMGARDAEVADLAIHIRGSHLTLGEIAPRQIPTLFHNADSSPFPAGSSGRLELARWIASPDNPLTARVFVNRVWRWHFGQGLVASPDNFGQLGERPSHPELLDWLASEFVASGWSVKHLHRLILGSSTWQQSSITSEQTRKLDPENRLYSRFLMRRLEAESIRDALLAVSGTLDRTLGGSLLHIGNRAYFFDHTSKDLTNYSAPRRSLYLPVVRNNLYPVFQLFDYSDASVPNGNRNSSTVAPQALFMLNSDLVMDSAASLSKRLFDGDSLSDEKKIERLYYLAYGRPVTSPERDRLLSWLRSESGDSNQQAMWATACQAILASNEFIFVR